MPLRLNSYPDICPVPPIALHLSCSRRGNSSVPRPGTPSRSSTSRQQPGKCYHVDLHLRRIAATTKPITLCHGHDARLMVVSRWLLMSANRVAASHKNESTGCLHPLIAISPRVPRSM